MKETQKEHLLRLFSENGNQLTLGMILNTPLAAEYRARFSELRKEGYEIICIPSKEKKSDNLYTLFGNRETPETNWHQEKTLCKCGYSWYTIDGKCNRCGEDRK